DCRVAGQGRLTVLGSGRRKPKTVHLAFEQNLLLRNTSYMRDTTLLPSMTSNQALFNDSRDVPMASSELAFVQQRLISFSKDPLAGTSAEFKVGLRSLPYLADHAFQDMIVLPGSLYVEMAFCIHANLLKQVVGTLRKATFQNPVILSAGDSTIRVMVKDQGGGN